jgi:hypothetical protein
MAKLAQSIEAITADGNPVATAANPADTISAIGRMLSEAELDHVVGAAGRPPSSTTTTSGYSAVPA